MAVRAAQAAAAANPTTVGANQPPSGSLADMIRRSNSTADPSTTTGTTGGLMQGVGAGNLMGGVNQATGATGGLMQGASVQPV
jgi:hypothetical protein